MQNATAVIKRLKKMLGIKTDLELSNILNVKPNTISSWKKRDSLQYDSIIALCKEHKIDLNELFFTDSSTIYNSNYQKRKVKMISADHHFEYFLDPEKTLASAPSFIFPTTEEVDTAFQVATENMYPTIKVSSYVITKRIELRDIHPWHLYLFTLEGRGIMIYRFKRQIEDNKLLFISDNTNFENLEVSPEDIREIFCVRGSFLPNFKNIGD
ncbi:MULTISPECIES: helix-turn-helix domain-containing protein [Myroides]|uniref:CI repressor n=1 Tax=Myroides albus TaxID=2562892 RepID=A0A6I3LGX0_9FLAO|nr:MULTISPECIES: helix-turn-helix domain-containing protein [Myroides]MTG97463.1 CI repressor [Myroides albus]MVX36142.1 CI repressor [Myroides sp. LoEW2-1]UVD79494.1 helix-turn-helix domain-containing protein [Myroides albus]